MKRDGSSREAALSRLNAQLPLADKLEYADNVIDNSGSMQDLEQQINALVTRLNKAVGWSWRLNWLIPPLGLTTGAFRLLWRMVKHSRAQEKKKRKAVPQGQR